MRPTRDHAGLDITPILPLVELHDPLETMIRIESSRLEEMGRRGLDSETQMNDGVDIRMSA